MSLKFCWKPSSLAFFVRSAAFQRFREGKVGISHKIAYTRGKIVAIAREAARLVRQQAKAGSASLGRGLDEFFRALYTFRVPLMLSTFSYLVFSQPDQIHELYITSFSHGTGAWLRLFVTGTLIFFLCGLFVILVQLRARKASTWITTLTAVFCSILPIFGILQGMYYGYVAKLITGRGLLRIDNLSVAKVYAVYREKYPDDVQLNTFPPEIFDFSLLDPTYQGLIWVVLVCIASIFFLTPFSRCSAHSFYLGCSGGKDMFAKSHLYRGGVILTVMGTSKNSSFPRPVRI